MLHFLQIKDKLYHMQSPINPQKKWKTIYDNNIQNQNKKPSFLSTKAVSKEYRSSVNTNSKISNNNLLAPSKETGLIRHLQFIRNKFSPSHKNITSARMNRKNFASESPQLKYKPRRQTIQYNLLKNTIKKRQNLKQSQRLVLPRSFQYKNAKQQLQIRKSTDIRYSNDPYASMAPTASQNNDRLSFLKKKSTTFKEIEVDDFIFLQFLGMGRMGQYFTALHKPTCFLVALKRINKKALLEAGNLNQLIISMQKQFSMDHPNIRKLFGFFDDEKYFYLVLEFMEGRRLDKHFKNLGKLREYEVGQKLHEICSAVKYIHNKNLIHRSLKLQCVFLSYGICKICDFDMLSFPTSMVMENNIIPQYNDLQRKMECRKSCFSYDLKCLGMMIYQLITGKPITQQQEYRKQLRQFKNVTVKNIDYSGCSGQAKQLIKLLLQTNLFNTMSITQIFNTNFLRKYKDEVEWIPRQFMPKKSDSPRHHQPVKTLIKRNSLNFMQ